MRTGCLALSVVLSGVVCGCGGGDAPPKYAVSGTVTYQGLALDKGTILFLPADGKGPPDGAPIIKGNFQCEATLGEKKVQIRASLENKGGAEAEGDHQMPTEMNMPAPVIVEMVPEKYNSNTTLTKEVTTGDNVFEFKLD